MPLRPAITRDPWRRIARGILLGLAMTLPAGQLLAAPVTKTFVAEGVSSSCAGAICKDSVFHGKIDYLDPDDAVASRLGLADVSLFTFDVGFGRRQLLIPYGAPRPGVEPRLSFTELGDSIELELLAFSDFDPAPGSTDTGVRWRLARDGSFDWNDGHGEVIFGRIDAVQWQRAPEPGTLLLAAVAGLALIRQARVRRTRS
jgi:hypothetical protein